MNKINQLYFTKVALCQQTNLWLSKSPDRIGIWKCWFLKREENWRPGEKPTEQGEN